MTGLGYVDDAVVLALLAGSVGSFIPQTIKTPAPVSDEMDYAGWPSGILSARCA
jgi:hypothetical protein